MVGFTVTTASKTKVVFSILLWGKTKNFYGCYYLDFFLFVFMECGCKFSNKNIKMKGVVRRVYTTIVHSDHFFPQFDPSFSSLLNENFRLRWKTIIVTGVGGFSCKKISLVIFQIYLTPKYSNGYPNKIVPPGRPQITSSSGSDTKFICSVPHFVTLPFLYYTIAIPFFAPGGVPLRSMNIIVLRVQR